MNNLRRKALADALERLSGIRSELETLRDDLESLKDEEREAFDAMPEGLQSGDKGQASEAAADKLDEAHSEVEDILSYLDTAETAIEEARA